MPISSEKNDNSVVIKIDGRFDYSTHQEFRNAYEQSKPTDNYILDMSQTEYMDSSALGMLLLIREHAGGDDAKIRIIKTNQTVKEILKTTGFQLMFEIE